MLETSADVLKIVLAGSIGLFTLFLCWGLFYFVMTMRNVLSVTRDARKLFDKAEEVLDAIKNKIHSSASYLVFIGEAVKKIADILNSDEGKFHFPGFGKKKKGTDRKKKKSKSEPLEKQEIKSDSEDDDEDDPW